MDEEIKGLETDSNVIGCPERSFEIGIHLETSRIGIYKKVLRPFVIYVYIIAGIKKWRYDGRAIYAIFIKLSKTIISASWFKKNEKIR